MTYAQREESTQQGSPQYLYEFKLNNKTWRYVNTAAQVFVLGQIWSPLTMSDDGVKQKGDPISEVLNIRCQADIDIVRFFQTTPPSSPIEVKIRRHHVGDEDAAVCFVGEVTNVNQPRPGEAIISCNTLGASLERNGVRLSWSRTCPFSVYDSSCKVLKVTMALPATILTAVDGGVTVNTIGGNPDNWFNGGFMEWADPLRGIERRAIELQTGIELMMFGTSDGLEAGMQVILYPGCDRIAQTCRDKFNNLPNHGGVPSMPVKSPFDGDPIY